jgi:hypothetical protein
LYPIITIIRERTPRMKRIAQGIGTLLILLVTWSPLRAAAPLVVGVDLPTLIDKVGGEPERFAVEVQQRVSASTDGQWSTNGSTRIWKHTVQVPTAVSMSFHASHIVMPPSAVLTVTGTRASVTYRARDLTRSGLWARPLLGDTLTLSLSVAAAEASRVQFEIDTLQAGYRGLGSAPSHAHYLKRFGVANATTQSCTENYSCDQTPANQKAARATVAILIQNLYQCTGTLLNNTRNDQAPLILTARHCENGALGGGNPAAAASVSIYWDAIAPCGGVLGTIYDGGAPVQWGATTLVEQQDAWLLKLDSAPVAQDAYWAGWDATGGTFTGGYSIHHALGFNKQYVQWYGQSVLLQMPGKTLNVGYNSTFWGVVNQVGSVGAGASGGALFDPNNNVIGSASLATLQNGPNSAGVCPVTPPPVPAADTITATYTALSGVFASTADATSTTGSTTIQSVLDPARTGLQLLGGSAVLPVTLTANDTAPTTFRTLTLSWNVAGAQSCTASGGVTGDGWAGSKAISGTATINNYTGGNVSYTLTCSNGADLFGHSTVNVDWIYIAPYVDLTAPGDSVMLGGVSYLFWSSNVSPCVASGGLAGDGWAGNEANNPGQQAITATQTGTITYSMTCGTGPQTASAQATVTVVPLSVTMHADSTQIRIGSQATLLWTGGGTSGNCHAAGGSSTDNWAQQIYENSNGEAYVTETTPGTYSYSIVCEGGGQSVTSSTSVTFTNDPPTVSLTALAPTQQVYSHSATNIQTTADLTWTSNVTPCNLAALGPLGNTGVTLQGTYPSGTAGDVQFIAGTYTYVLQCGAQQATATITWVNPQSTVTLATMPTPTTTWVANYQYQLWWTTDTTPFVQTGGAPGDGWAGNATAGQASEFVTETAPGNYTFTVACGTGVSSAQAQLNVTVPPPAVTISVSPTTISAYQPTTLTWNSTIAPCTSVDPAGIGVNWGGSSVGPFGSFPIIAQAPGTYTYTITCGSGNQTVHASTQLSVNAPTPTTVTASTLSAAVNTPVQLTWTSSSPCEATGGDGTDGWSGTLPATGSTTVTSSTAQTVVYGVNCNGVAAETQVAYTAPATAFTATPTPSVTLTSSTSSQTAGSSITLTWSAQNTNACTATGGVAGDAWTGSLPTSGSMQIAESGANSNTYGITCTGAPPAARSQVTVNFTTGGSQAGGGSSSGGGGGGAFDKPSLLWLSLILLLRPVVLHSRQRRIPAFLHSWSRSAMHECGVWLREVLKWSGWTTRGSRSNHA